MDTIKIVESQENSRLLIDGATETVIGPIMAPMAASLIAPAASYLTQLVVSLLINIIYRKESQE